MSVHRAVVCYVSSVCSRCRAVLHVLLDPSTVLWLMQSAIWWLLCAVAPCSVDLSLAQSSQLSVCQGTKRVTTRFALTAAGSTPLKFAATPDSLIRGLTCKPAPGSQQLHFCERLFYPCQFYPCHHWQHRLNITGQPPFNVLPRTASAQHHNISHIIMYCLKPSRPHATRCSCDCPAEK